MERPRFLAVLLAGLLLPVIAPRCSQLLAQSSSTNLSYDDLAAAAKRAEAEKEAAVLKHNKKGKHAEPAVAASTPVASAPVAPATAVRETTPAGSPAPVAAAVAPAEPAKAAPVAEAPVAAAPVAASAPATPAAVAEAPAAAPEPPPASSSPASAAPAAPPAPATVAAEAPAAAPGASAADGTVPSAPTAAAAAEDADADADGAMPKVAPKMQRTLFGKMKPVKEKAPKLVPVTIVHGELTVDGLIAKAGLNFQIVDLKYFYIWVPGLGTTIVSNQPFPGSQIQESALDGSTLTVSVEGHKLQLACDRDMLGGKKPKPMSMFVALDKNFDKSSIYPEFGYGTVLKAPYNWPGTLADLHPNTKAPPLPANLRQNTESIKTCHKNEDGTQSNCRTVEVPMVLGKSS